MKKIMRLLLLFAAGACVALNIGPVVVSGQVNIGVIVGFGAAALCILYAVRMEKLNRALAKLWRKKTGKIAVLFCALCVASGLAVGGFTFAKVVQYSQPAKTPTEYIIVLGCKVNGTEPGIYLRARINKALEYLQANPESKAVLSGGQGSDEDISEAQCMYNRLTAAGISPDRLLVENASASTMENFKNSLALLKSKGVTITEITVVTNDFHEYRASKFAERCGLKAYAYPTRTSWTGYVPFAVREVFAVVYQVYLSCHPKMICCFNIT